MFKYLKVLPFFFFSGYSCSNNVLENLIEVDNPLLKVNFFNSSQQHEKLKAIHINFYAQSSCRGKRLASNVSESSTYLSILPAQTFSLAPNSLYQLASEFLDEQEILRVRSGLFRFINQEGQWAKFIKGCQVTDKVTECCVNIHCHPSETNCDFDVDELKQALRF